MTTQEGIFWAQEVIEHLGGDIRAAFVRDHDLYLITQGDGYFDTLVYQLVRFGEVTAEFLGQDPVCETSEGLVYLTYGWQEKDEALREIDEDIKSALEDARRKLDISSTPEERKQKVIELLRWGYQAERGG